MLIITKTAEMVQIEALHGDKRGLDKVLERRQGELSELQERLKGAMVPPPAKQSPVLFGLPPPCCVSTLSELRTSAPAPAE